MNWQVIILIVITVLGAAVRLINIDESLWLDELHSSWSVSGSLSEVASRAGDGNQPPLYYWVGWVFAQVGQTEFNLRLLSLIPGIAMIPLSWAIVNRFSRSIPGSLLAATLVAFDPELIFFSTEFRGYVFVSFVGMIQIAVFADLLLGPMSRSSASQSSTEAESSADQITPHSRNGRRKKAGKRKQVSTTHELKQTPESRGAENSAINTTAEPLRVSRQTRLWFCALTILLFNLHFTAILILLPEIAFTLIAFTSSRFRQRYSISQFLIDGLIIAVGCSPLVMLVLGIEGKREDWAPIVRAWPIRLDFLRIICGYLVPLLLACIGYAAVLANFKEKSFHETFESHPLRVVLVFFACTAILVGTVWLLTFFKVATLFLPRYVSVVMAASAIAAGILTGVYRTSLASIRLPIDWILALVLLAVSLASTQHFHPWANRCWQQQVILPMRHEPWNEVVRELNQGAKPGEKVPVFLMSTLVEDYRLFSEFEPTDRFVEYCRFPLSGIYELDRSKYKIIPIPSLIDRERFKEERIPMEELDYVSQGKLACIIARGDPVVVDVFNELELRLNKRNRRLVYDAKYYNHLCVIRFTSAPLEPVETSDRGNNSDSANE